MVTWGEGESQGTADGLRVFLQGWWRVVMKLDSGDGNTTFGIY